MTTHQARLVLLEEPDVPATADTFRCPLCIARSNKPEVIASHMRTVHPELDAT